MLTYLNIGKFGRLGNQMFQIASTIGVAKKNKIDFSFPPWYCQYTRKNHNQFFNKNLPTLKNKNNILFIQEKEFNYNEIIIKNTDKDYSLSGYFQSEKYFKEYSDVIIDYFTLKPEIENNIIYKYKDVLNNSCSLHIRRGDYLNLQNLHPVQNINYFYEAINIIYGDSFSDINFLIFSDDVGWCKSNFNLPNIHFIENNLDIIDLFLMSKCDNNIISNSSFSWWGAWLNKKINKKIIAPKNWFGLNYSHLNTKDLYCDDWTII